MTDMSPADQNANRNIFLVTWIIFIFFIIYGTLIPFNLSPDNGLVNSNISNINWIPFIDSDGSRASIPDMVQNILLFIPFGFLGVFSIRHNSKVVTIIKITLLGSLLSGFVEFLQLFTDDRTTSMTDLFTNSSGAFIGAVSAFVLLETFSTFINIPRFQKLREDKYFFLVIIASIVVGVGTLHPFDFTLDVGSVGSKVKYLLKNPIEFNQSLSDEGVVFIRLFLFSYVCGLWFKRRNIQNFNNKAFIFAAMFAIILEMSQIFVKSRMPGFQDIFVIILACFIGSQFTRIRLRTVRKKTWAILIVSATGIAAGIQMLNPFRFENKSGGFNWIPFLAYYERTTFLALANFIESMLIYFPMGFILMYLYYNSINILRVVIFMLIGVIISASFEFMQIWISGRYADITDILGALVGVIAGTLVCWQWKLIFGGELSSQ